MKKRIRTLALQAIFWIYSFIPFHIEAQSRPENRVIQKRSAMTTLIEQEKFDEIETERVMFVGGRSYVSNNYLMIFEKEILHLLKGEYKILLDEILTNEEDYFQARNNRTYLIGLRFREAPYRYAERSFGDDFNKTLLNYLALNDYQIITSIKNAGLKESEELFLIYYLYLNAHYNDQCAERYEDLMAKHAKIFMDKFPSSPYAYIIKKYSPYKRSDSKWGREFTMGFLSAYIQTPNKTSTLHEHFGNMIGVFPMTLGRSYGNTFINFQGSMIVGGDLKTNQFPGWQKNDYFGWNGQLTIGHSFTFPDRNFTISPFIGWDGYILETYLKTHEHIDKEKELDEPITETIRFRSRQFIAGVNLDFDINYRYRCPNGKPNQRVFQRIQLGLTSINTPVGSELAQGRMLFINYAIGLRTQRERRVPIY